MNVIGPEEQKLYIGKVIEWFVAAMGDKAWEARRARAEQFYINLHKPVERYSRSLNDNEARGVLVEDPFAWYVYLAETFISESTNYDYAQGSRVVPIFMRLGIGLSILEGVKGIEGRIAKLVHPNSMDPDSTLFELLAALSYSVNGWDSVEFLEEVASKKTPDLRVSSEAGDIYIECKRMSKSSEYSLAEREKWLRMWQPVSVWFERNEIPFWIDVTFHCELKDLSDNFLELELIPKLKLTVTSSCNCGQ